MVVTVVGFSGGGAGGRFAEHGGGCPLGDAAPDACLAVCVQPAAPAARTTARRVRRNFHVDIGITPRTEDDLFLALRV